MKSRHVEIVKAVDIALKAGASPAVIGKLAANSGVDIGDVTLTAGENHAGQVNDPETVIPLTLTLDTNAYTTGDVFFDVQELANVARKNGAPVILQSIQVEDEDGNAVDFEMLFLDGNNSIGAENAAIALTGGTSSRSVQGIVATADGTWFDMGTVNYNIIRNIGMEIQPASNSTSLWIGGVIRGSGTYTASGVRLKLGFLQT